MSDESHVVLFAGEIAAGFELLPVQQALARLFKIDMLRVQKLFSSEWVTIKKGVSFDVADKYRSALLQAGAVTYVMEAAEVAAFQQQHKRQQSSVTPKTAGVSKRPATPPPPASTVVTTAAESATKPVSSNVDKVSHAPVNELGQVIFTAVADISALADIEVNEDWDALQLHEEVAEPEIDIAHIDMAAAGTDLVEHEEIAPLQVDTTHIHFVDTDEPLSPTQPEVELNIDTSKLQLID